MLGKRCQRTRAVVPGARLTTDAQRTVLHHSDIDDITGASLSAASQ